MMAIDMTAQLSPLLVGMNVLLMVAGMAIVASVWQRRVTSSANTESTLAVVGSSTSAPVAAGEAPSDSSVPEAA